MKVKRFFIILIRLCYKPETQVIRVSMSRCRFLGVIPARWQSSRFPGKPLVNILGKSLIRRTYENSQQSRLLDRLVIATDDKRIAVHAEEFGAEVFMTSRSCPTGTDRIAEVVKSHFMKVEIVVNIQGDEPCLDPNVVDTLIEKLKQTPDAVLTTPIVKITNPSDIFRPSVVKCVFDNRGRILYFSRLPIPFLNRTDVNFVYYRHLGIYCFRRDFLLQYTQLKPTQLQTAEDLEQLKVLENGYPIHYCLVGDQGMDLNTPEDLKRIEGFLCRKNTSSSQVALSHH